MVRGEGSSGSPAPRRAPAPEGPEEIAERVRCAREGLPTAARRGPARLFGLEKLSPVRQVLTLFAAAVEFSLLGLGLFTDLPISWLLMTALVVLPLLLHHFGRQDERGAGTATRHARDAARTAGEMARRAGRRRRT